MRVQRSESPPGASHSSPHRMPRALAQSPGGISWSALRARFGRPRNVLQSESKPPPPPPLAFRSGRCVFRSGRWVFAALSIPAPARRQESERAPTVSFSGAPGAPRARKLPASHLPEGLAPDLNAGHIAGCNAKSDKTRRSSRQSR